MEIKNTDYQNYPTQKSVRYDTKDKPGQRNTFVSSWTKNNFYQILLNFIKFYQIYYSGERTTKSVVYAIWNWNFSLSVNKDAVEMTEK